MTRYIGKEMSRVDGVAKVTGRAKYAAEFQVPNIAYGFIVLGSVAKGTIKSIDTREAERSPGVIRVFTHLNTPKLGPKGSTEEAPPRGTQEEQDRSFRALQSDRVFFNMQPVALVVAETYEQARYAARLVRVSYNAEKHVTDTEAVRESARVPPRTPLKPRGNPEQAMRAVPVKV